MVVLTGIPNYPAGRFFDGYGFFSPSCETHNGIKIVRAPLIPRGSGRFMRLALNYLSFAVAASLVGPIRCRQQFDLILAYEPSPITVALPALLIKKLRRIPLFLWVQDLWPESLSATGAVKSPWILRQMEHMVRSIYRRCDLILVQSEAFIPSVLSLGGRADAIAYFPNTAESFYRHIILEPDAPERAELPSGFRVMFAGNLGAAQDLSTLIAAAEHLKDHSDVQWIIIGDGRMRDWLHTQVRDKGLEHCVHLLGTRAATAMPRYFALADVLLVTLKKQPIFALTVPSKLQSYLACGRPIIAALEGEGARLVREAGVGLTAPPEDAQALASAVIEMKDASPACREQMGARGREFFEKHFDRTRLIERLEGWMMDSAGRRKCAY